MQKTLALIQEDLTHRFESELEWKNTLEGKALSFLGFVGVALTILFAVLTDNPETRGPNANLATAPALLLIVAVMLLTRAFFGYSIHAGPTPLQVFQDRKKAEEEVRTSLTRAYAQSLLTNRIRFSKARFFFQLSVLVSVAGIVQLGLSLAAINLDPARSAGQSVWSVWPWCPGAAGAAAAVVLLWRGDRRFLTKVKEDLNRWMAAMETEENERR